MSGFTIRRFVLQNITAVAAHCPSVTVASTAVAVMTGVTVPPTSGASASSSSAASAQAHGASRVSSWVQTMLTGGAASSVAAKSRFGLVTAEEMEWIRRRRREDAEESRVVLATRPGRSMLRGVGGGALNCVLGFVVSPLVFLAVALERIRLGSGVSALLVGPCYGFVWGGVFFACAQYAAVQQVFLCGYYSCVAAPLYYCVNRRPLASRKAETSDATAAAAVTPRARAWLFNVLSCRFEAPQGTLHAHHSMLLLYDEPSVLRERAMKRLAQRDRNKHKKDAHYSGRKKRAGAGPDDDDYYGLLGLSHDATARQIKEAYSQKALHLHPDRNPSPNAAQEFDRVTKAYRVLSNPQKRKKFDLAGAKGVEDTGVKKREGVRALFGGEELNKLAGDTFLGSFSQRVIDGLDFTADELAVIRQCMYESCRDELLSKYLAHYDPSAAATSEEKTTNGAAKRTTVTGTAAAKKNGPWKGDAVALQLRKMLNTGLAKEVLFTIGHEYKRVVAYFDMEKAGTSLPSLAVQRGLFYLRVAGPHRWHLQRQKIKYLMTVRSHTFKNPEAMVDLAWYTSVQELEATARHVALTVLYDPTLTAAEATTRRDALDALADTFILYGEVHKGVSKATVDQLMNSLREYQQQRQREKDSE